MQNLKQWMASQNLTQERLAEKLGVTQGAVSHWLVGRARPSLDVLLDLEEVTGLTLHQLLDKDDA